MFGLASNSGTVPDCNEGTSSMTVSSKKRRIKILMNAGNLSKP